MTTSNDPRPHFLAAAAAVSATARSVQPRQLGLATPCSEFDVRGLLGHLVGVLARAEGVGIGLEPMSVPAEGYTADGDDWGGALDTAAEKARAAWADDARLARTVVFPWVTQDGAESLRMWTNELVVHGWDLAVATGAPFAPPADVVTAAMAAIRTQLPMAERQPLWDGLAASFGVAPGALPAPFADAVPVGADASPLDEVVAWNGRDPKWRAA